MSKIKDEATRLRAIFRLIGRRADALNGRNATPRSELSVLAWLNDDGPMTPSALARVHRVRPQSMGQTLDALERRRWIKRSPHPDDRRQVLVTLQAAGRTTLEKKRRVRQAWLEGEIGKLTRNERRTLSAALDLLDRFLADDPTPTPKI